MADQNEPIAQDEIEQLLRASMGEGKGSHGAQTSQTAKPPPPAFLNNAGTSGEPSPGRADAGARGQDAASPAPQVPLGADLSSDSLGANEIADLLSQAGVRSAATAPMTATLEDLRTATSPVASESQEIAQSDIESLLHQAEKALASINEGQAEPIPAGVAPFRWEDLTAPPANVESASLDLIRDVELDLRIELGRTQMYLEDILRLRRGSVVTLDKLAGDPVDIFVNGRLVARGEVLVLNDNFCVRVAELVAGVNSA